MFKFVGEWQLSKNYLKILFLRGMTKSIIVYNYMQVENLKSLNKSKIMQNVLFHWSLKIYKNIFMFFYREYLNILFQNTINWI